MTKARITRRGFSIAAACALATGFVPEGRAQAAWPARPLRLIVPFPAGISADVVARMIGEPLSVALRQPVIVENKPGASGIIGASALKGADDHTMLMTVDSIVGVLPHVYPKLPFDPLRDFEPVTQLTNVPWVLVAGRDAPFKSVRELFELAKQKPGTIDYGSLGLATGSHVRMEMIAHGAGIKLNHIPYKGSPMSDLLAGQIPLSLEPSTTALPQVRSGRLHALAVTTARRIPELPEVPALGELLPGFDAPGWHGIHVAAGVPKEVVQRLNAEISSVLRSESVQRRLAELSVSAVGSSVAEFAALCRTEYQKWGAVVKAAGIRLE